MNIVTAHKTNAQIYFPLYRDTDPIYGEHGEVLLPLACVERLRKTDKARLLMNTATGAEAWFPEAAFSYHWHVVSVLELVVFLSLPKTWVRKKAAFFAPKETRND